jgi:hypothetical protein
MHRQLGDSSSIRPPCQARARPLTCRDGFDGSIAVTILPKMWRAGGQVVRRYSCQVGETTHVVAHEGDFIQLTGAADLLGSLALNLAQLTGIAESELIAACSAPKRQGNTSIADIGDPFNALIDLMLIADKGGIDPSDETYDGLLIASLVRIIEQEQLLREIEPLLFRARPRYIERTELSGT